MGAIGVAAVTYGLESGGAICAPPLLNLLTPGRKACPVTARLRMRDLRRQSPGPLGASAAFTRSAHVAVISYSVAASGASGVALSHDLFLSFELMSGTDRHSIVDRERCLRPDFSQRTLTRCAPSQ